LALVASGWLAGALWWNFSRVSPWQLWLWLMALCLASSAAWLHWCASPTGTLHWDGQDWHWERAGHPGVVSARRIAVIADFQNLLVLRFENAMLGDQWMSVEKRFDPLRWMDFRRAVYSPRRGSTGTGNAAAAAHG
jgi:hypothetical protein